VSDSPGPDPAPQPKRPDGAVEVRLRRAPRYGPFVVTGVVVGVVLGIVVALAFDDPVQAEQFSTSTIVRYFAAILGLVGGVVGAAVALLAERRRR
jgi:membrane associated rhomboid family serine protease